MKKALIIGSSGGIGRAVERQLLASGWHVQGLSRRADGLNITQEDSIARVFSTLEGVFDLVIIATGALEICGSVPEKTIKTLDARAMGDQFATNAVGPMLVLKHVIPFMPKDRPTHVVVLSARVGSIGDNALGGWYSYRAAKTALNQLVHTAAIELGRSNPQLCCVCYHPGTVQTDFTAKYVGRHSAVSPETAASNLVSVVSQLSPLDTGRFFDWTGAQVPW